MKFRIRNKVDGKYWLALYCGTTEYKKAASIYTYLPSNFDKLYHKLELVL